MTVPKLAVAASGFGGRGYRKIFEGDGKEVVMSITTALGALDKPGLRMWERQQVAAYAVANAHELLNRTEERGFRYLQAVPKILTEKAVDELEEVDIYTSAEHALNDAANAGTWIHNWIDEYLTGMIPEDPEREDHAEMVVAFLDWYEENESDIEILYTETTVFGGDYAGTFDIIIRFKGKTYLVDIKTSRRVYDSHVSQMSALGAAVSMAVEAPEGAEGAVYHKMTPAVAREHGGQVDSWWVEEPLPPITNYAVLQVRPGDYDNDGNYIPPFCEFHEIDQRLIDVGFGVFEASKEARKAQYAFKQVEKLVEKEVASWG